MLILQQSVNAYFKLFWLISMVMDRNSRKSRQKNGNKHGKLSWK